MRFDISESPTARCVNGACLRCVSLLAASGAQLNGFSRAQSQMVSFPGVFWKNFPTAGNNI